MAYREVDMWEILEVLRRAGRSESITQIKQATGRSRKTIRKYVRLARKLGWVPGDQEPTEELAGSIRQHLKPVPEEITPGVAESQLLPHRDRIRLWLEGSDHERGLCLAKVHQLLGREGVQVPYSSLHRFVVKHCGFADRRRMTVRRAPCTPGELAEVDFGRLGLVWDPITERRRFLYALIVTLGYSRHMYVHTTMSQKYDDLIEGLENAWFFFGGVVRRVVLDNLKAAIFKADRYDPIYQRTFSEYGHYRGFVIDAAVPRDPTGKPVVERAVPYVRENFFRGETWLDPWHVRGEAVRWCLETAGTRIHGTTRKRPLAVFENLEKSALRPLDKPRFDPPQWAPCTVHWDHHVSFQKALYSVPTRWVGHEVWVRGDTKLVRIFADGQLVKTHPHQQPGSRSTDYDDYPKEKTPYALRDPQRLIHAAAQNGEHLGRFMEQLLSGDFPWAKLRQGQKLLRLCDKYGSRCVEQACCRALAFELINVRRVESIIQQHLEQAPHPQRIDRPADVVPLRFGRDPRSFIHPKPEGEEHD
jgi:transposase